MFIKFSDKGVRIAAALAVSLALSTPVVHGRNPEEPGFPAGIRLAAKARGEAAIAALGNRLPEVAAFHGKPPQRLREVLRADNSLGVNPEGRLCDNC